VRLTLSPTFFNPNSNFDPNSNPNSKLNIIRLSERKLSVCKKLRIECELEIRQSQYVMDVISDRLYEDDDVEEDDEQALDVQDRRYDNG
jgi:hypothetical protein